MSRVLHLTTVPVPPLRPHQALDLSCTRRWPQDHRTLWRRLGRLPRHATPASAHAIAETTLQGSPTSTLSCSPNPSRAEEPRNPRSPRPGGLSHAYVCSSCVRCNEGRQSRRATANTSDSSNRGQPQRTRSSHRRQAITATRLRLSLRRGNMTAIHRAFRALLPHAFLASHRASPISIAEFPRDGHRYGPGVIADELMQGRSSRLGPCNVAAFMPRLSAAAPPAGLAAVPGSFKRLRDNLRAPITSHGPRSR